MPIFLLQMYICNRVIKVSQQRDPQLIALYERIAERLGGKANQAKSLHDVIAEHAYNNRPNYPFNGQNGKLSNELAFHAGVRDVLINPKMQGEKLVPDSSVTPEIMAEITRDCYRPGYKSDTQVCYGAGMELGKQIKLNSGRAKN